MQAKWVVVLTVVSVSMCTMASDNAEPFKVGEKWVYKHEGPRPFGWNMDPVDGDWVRAVDSVKTEGDKKVWIIKEIYGEEDQSVSREVNVEKQVISLEIGDQTLSYSEPLPYDFPTLAVGEEKKIETKMEGPMGAWPLTFTYKREADETISVPAGEFKDCHHYKVTNVIKFEGNGESFEMKNAQDLWSHPDTNGIVKRIFVSDPDNTQSDRHFTATDELKEHAVAEN